MKRIFLLFALLLFFGATESVAQRLSQSQFGVRAGLSAATLWSDDLDGLHRRAGLVVGGLARMELTRRIGLQPELLYVRKGTSMEDGPRTDVFRVSYLQLPVLATYAIPIQGPLRPYVTAGPVASLRVSERLELILDDEPTTIDDVDLFRRTDAGFVVGGGIGYDIHPDYRLLLDVRYDLGLVDVTTGQFGESVSARTSTLVLSLAVMFP